MQWKNIAKDTKFRLVEVFLLQIILFALLFDPKIFMGGDAHAYFNLAESIRDGSYREIWTPENKLNSWIPPLFPLILVPFGHNYLAVKGLMILLTLLSTYLIWQLFRNWWVLLLFVSNLAVLEFSHYELTEIPYLVCVLGFFYCWRQAKTVPFFILMVCGFYLRSEGILLYLTFLIGGLIYYRKSILLKVSIGYLLSIIPWLIYSYSAGDNERLIALLQKDIYRPELGNIGVGDFILRVIHNFKYYFIGDGGNILINFHWIFTLPLMVIAFVGLLKNHEIILIFAALHFGLLLCWTESATHWRYALCLSPFLMLGLVNGLQPVLLWIKRALRGAD